MYHRNLLHCAPLVEPAMLGVIQPRRTLPGFAKTEASSTRAGSTRSDQARGIERDPVAPGRQATWEDGVASRTIAQDDPPLSTVLPTPCPFAHPERGSGGWAGEQFHACGERRSFATPRRQAADEESRGALLVPRNEIASDRQHRLSFTSVRAMHIGNLSARFSGTSEYGYACRNCRCRHGRAFRRHGTCCRRAPGGDF